MGAGSTRTEIARLAGLRLTSFGTRSSASAAIEELTGGTAAARQVESMIRTISSLVGLVVLALALSAAILGCSGETSGPVETAPDAVIETVALTVEGMT